MNHFTNNTVYYILALLCLGFSGTHASDVRKVIPAMPGGKTVSPDVMNDIYEQIQTPFKYGVVLKGDNGQMVDSPSVFRHGDKWYMTFITFEGAGYESSIAVSNDLLTWNVLGKILPFRNGTWDSPFRLPATLLFRITTGAVRTSWQNTIANTGCLTSAETSQATKQIH